MTIPQADIQNCRVYRVQKNSMPKLCEVTGGTKTKIYCQATTCQTCILVVPRSIKVGVTKFGNQAKPLNHCEK